MINHEQFSAKFFPAKLTPFEHYMFYKDDETRPMTTFAQLIFSGPLDLDALQASLGDAVQRHPLLSATIRHRGLTRWEWIPSTRPLLIDVAPESEPMSYAGCEQIDLTQEPGMRLWVRHHEGGGRILMQMHHSAADGRGKFNFLTDWLALYSQHCNTGIVADELPPPNFAALFDRGAIPTSRMKSSKFSQLKRAINRIFANRARPVILQNSINTAESDSPPDDMIVEKLSTEDFMKLRETARRHEMKLNDWLLARLFVHLLTWQEEQGEVDAESLFRVLAPYDVRQSDERCDPASNRVSLKFLNRLAREIRHPDDLLSGIAREMQPVRDQTTNHILLKTLSKLDHIPGLLRRFVKKSRQSANAVLSNLGNVVSLYSPPLPVVDGKWRAADLTVEEVHNTVIAPEEIPIAMGVVGYANQLTFVSRPSRRGFDHHWNRTFMQRYIAQLLNETPVASEPMVEA